MSNSHRNLETLPKINIEKIGLTKSEFEEQVFDVANDRIWCKGHGINYVSPDMNNVRNILYKEILTLKKYASQGSA